MRVIGIDSSTKTGIAIVSEKGIEFVEEIEFKKLTGLDRAAAIVGRIMEIKAKWQPDLGVMEGYGFANAHTLATLVEIGTVIRYFMWQEDFPLHLVAPNSLKKFATGKGTSKKNEVMLAVYKRWGFTASTDNIADAVVLAQMGFAGVSSTNATKCKK